jgi:glycosyltransferase involved in cell wall biosynthesis
VTLLQTFATLRAAEPRVELWLVGPTDLDPGNQPLVDKARQTAGVVVRGSVKHAALPPLFRRAWVSVLLSQTTRRWAEQVGMVALQSLACGTPVVATDSGAIREYLEAPSIRASSGARHQSAIGDTRHGALVVPEADSALAAQALLTIIHDSALRERMGRAGVRWIRQTFDEAATVSALDRDSWTRWRQWRHDHGGEPW